MWLHRNDYTIRCSQSIDCQHPERGHAVYDDIVIFVLDLIEVSFKDVLPAHGVDKRCFQSRELNIGWKKINVIIYFDDSFTWRNWTVIDDFGQDIRNGDWNGVQTVVCQHHREIGLGIKVN